MSPYLTTAHVRTPYRVPKEFAFSVQKCVARGTRRSEHIKNARVSKHFDSAATERGARFKCGAESAPSLIALTAMAGRSMCADRVCGYTDVYVGAPSSSKRTEVARKNMEKSTPIATPHNLPMILFHHFCRCFTAD